MKRDTAITLALFILNASTAALNAYLGSAWSALISGFVAGMLLSNLMDAWLDWSLLRRFRRELENISAHSRGRPIP